MFEQLGFEVGRAIPWIVLLPLFGALANGLGGRTAPKWLVTTVGVGSVALAFVFALLPFLSLVFPGETGRTEYAVDLYTWFTLVIPSFEAGGGGGFEVPVRIRFVMDHLSGVMTVMVTGIATLIHIYSVGYMEEDEGFARFFTYLNLFTASMLILVLASNIPLMFVGWEGVGLCSYLLIGFWYENASYAAAGRKAFVVNRIGDFGVLIGTFIILAYGVKEGIPDVLEFAAINEHAFEIGRNNWRLLGADTGVLVATAATLFLFLGCTGKSAQIPLFVWLPDAMAGPTPVSALIHAATMVTAGVYLCCRLSPFMVESPFALSVIALTGAATALVAATIALVQNQMKKILAYSTVSQLGFMFAAVGMGAFGAGIFHVFTHAFFKACLFLGAGSVMHAIGSHSDADIRYQGGHWKAMPWTSRTFLVSCLAIAGLPVFSGFFSKDEILLGAATWATTSPVSPWVGWVVFATLVVAATLTAFYMFRLFFLTFLGEFRGGYPPPEPHEDGSSAHDDHHHHGEVHPHESPRAMTGPLVVLAVGAALVGFLGLPHSWGLPNVWSEFLTPRYETFLHELEHADHDEGEHGGEGDHAEAEAEGHGAEGDHHAAVEAAMAAADEVDHGLASLQFRDPLRPSQAVIAHAPPWVPLMALAFGLLAALLGTGLAYMFYAQGENPTPQRIADSVPWLYSFFLDKWRVDELYGVVVVGPMRWLGVLSANLDRILVDGLLTRVSSEIMRGIGWVLTRIQTGVVFVYASLFVFGFAAVGWWFLYPQVSLEGTPAGNGSVAWEASEGLGYEYRWDLDSNGTYESDWSDEPTYEGDYSGARAGALAVVLERPNAEDLFFNPNHEMVFGPGDEVVLYDDILGPAWAEDGGNEGRRPTLSYEDGTVVLTIHDANIPDLQGDREDGRIVLSPGDVVPAFFGYRLTIALRVRGSVTVRNVFGNQRTVRRTISVTVPRTSPVAAADPGANR